MNTVGWSLLFTANDVYSPQKTFQDVVPGVDVHGLHLL